MRIALVHPKWSFDGSIYFGCREAHLPLELGATHALLSRAGHEAAMFDGALDGLDLPSLVSAVAGFRPDMTLVTTAPTYLFWRCAQPELRVPAEFLAALGGLGGVTVASGPHGSVTPRAALRKLGADIVIRGECEEAVLELADGAAPEDVPGLAFWKGDEIVVTGGPRAARFTDLPVLRWPDHWVRRHDHNHHRFDSAPHGPGAEVEASRGCPYNCSFCAKIDFRDKYRRRDLAILAEEIDGLIAQGVAYLYFIDEIFLPWKELLDLLQARPVQFGVQTRIDLWKPEMIEALGAAGCVSVEAGVESLSPEGRDALDKKCRMTTEALTERLLLARRHIPFVQANLIEMQGDDAAQIEDWRDRMRAAGVWANDPVPLFPYPSSPDYRKLWGEPDDQAWERAHDHYLRLFESFSDIQEARPRSLRELERGAA
jgi:B12-binding domain/radical SAM domain protein of rhizo-twelve system